MARRPRLLDLFCGAGGAAMGYHLAGFDVVGVDTKAQPRYPFEFVLADANEYPLGGFDVVHASPPCHDHSALRTRTGLDHQTGWMLEHSIERLEDWGGPFVVENVERADMAGRPFFTLCGSMFGLKVRRHRRFVSSTAITPPPCRHREQGKVVGVYGHAGGSSRRDGKFHGTQEWREAMGIQWMTGAELAQSIPPAYTEFIGRHLVEDPTRGA